MKALSCLVSVILLLKVTTASEENLQTLVNANNLFATTVYKEIIKNESKSFLVSPFSAETVLSLLLSGCEGDTREELRNVLHLPKEQNITESAVKTTLAKLKGNDRYTLHIANKIYVKDNFSINEEFKNVATNIYQADIENIDFINTKEKAAKTINNWVEQQTANKIQNLIDPSVLDEDSRLILINALYFKANWSVKFDTTKTVKSDFYKSNEVVKTDMMHHYSKYFGYYKSHELKAKFLELPFDGDENISLIIVLPDEKEGLASLEDQIEKVLVHQQFRKTLLNVELPKFKIESKIDIKVVLENLGVHIPFDQGNLDLSGIAGRKGELVVSDVLQKTFIEISEEGGEAAAATYVQISYTRTAPVHMAPEEFKADHPFIFYIKARDFILFAGRVVTPA